MIGAADAAFTVDRFSQVAYRLGRYESARGFAEESLALYQDLGDSVMVAGALDTLGHLELIYLATVVFVVGAVLALRGIIAARNG